MAIDQQLQSVPISAQRGAIWTETQNDGLSGTVWNVFVAPRRWKPRRESQLWQRVVRFEELTPQGCWPVAIRNRALRDGENQDRNGGWRTSLKTMHRVKGWWGVHIEEDTKRY